MGRSKSEQRGQQNNKCGWTARLCNDITNVEGAIILSGGSKDGLVSILTGHCSSCRLKITLETSKKVKGPHSAAGKNLKYVCVGEGEDITVYIKHRIMGACSME